MPEKKYFVGLFMAFLLGIVALILAGIAFFLLIPFFIPLAVLLAMGALTLAIFIIVWVIIYVLVFVGVALYYMGKPIDVKKTGEYKIGDTKEAGRRRKGKSK